ncbi:hypothetical protein ACFU99_25865, partial [Streptomyces sp. NPDC057654]|uniref:hypothetical protein n=1 Tax=Streptomyces sp. NPDC057654 TaxID=3346196 RepID=UPI0036CDAC06
PLDRTEENTMGAIENNEVLMYGYCLGGPVDNWQGLTNKLVGYTDCRGSSFVMPHVPWETQDMLDGYTGDSYPRTVEYFTDAAAERLAANGLGSLLLQTYTLPFRSSAGMDEDEVGYCLAAVVHEPKNRLLKLDLASMNAASQHDGALKRALSVLGLQTRVSEPEWFMSSYEA